MNMLNDTDIRDSWVEGNNVLIYSNSRESWFVGTISRIFEDEDGEWLEIGYDETRLKQIQRYNPELKPTEQQTQQQNETNDDTSSEVESVKESDIQSESQSESQSEITDDSNAETISQAPQAPQAEQTPESKEEEKQQSQQTQSNVSLDWINKPLSPNSYEYLLRQEWKKADEVEVYDCIDNEWYSGDIMDVTNDEYGEWLNIIWARPVGDDHYEALFQQIQRFSKLIRPVYVSLRINDDNDNSDDLPNLSLLAFDDDDDNEDNCNDSDNNNDIINDNGDDIKLFSPMALMNNNNNNNSDSEDTHKSNENDSDNDCCESTFSFGNIESDHDNTSHSGNEEIDDYIDIINIFEEEIKSKDNKLIKAKNNNIFCFERRAPEYKITECSSTFTFPATSSLRENMILEDIDEDEESQFKCDGWDKILSFDDLLVQNIDTNE